MSKVIDFPQPNVDSCPICFSAKSKDETYCIKCTDEMKLGIIAIILTDESTPEHPIRTGEIYLIEQSSAEMVFKNIDFARKRLMTINESLFKSVFTEKDRKDVTDNEQKESE